MMLIVRHTDGTEWTTTLFAITDDTWTKRALDTYAAVFFSEDHAANNMTFSASTRGLKQEGASSASRTNAQRVDSTS